MGKSSNEVKVSKRDRELGVQALANHPKFPWMRKYVDRYNIVLTEEGVVCDDCNRPLQLHVRQMIWSAGLMLGAHRDLFARIGQLVYVKNTLLKGPLQELMNAGQKQASQGGAYLESKYWGMLRRRVRAQKRSIHGLSMVTNKELATEMMFTQRGLRYVRGDFPPVPQYAWVFDDVAVAFFGPKVTFKEVCGQKFERAIQVYGWGVNFPELASYEKEDFKRDWRKERSWWSSAIGAVESEIREKMKKASFPRIDPDQDVDDGPDFDTMTLKEEKK